MKPVVYLLLVLLSSVRLVPHLAAFGLSRRRSLISADVKRWQKMVLKNETRDHYCQRLPLISLLTLYPEFRTLFYHRVGWTSAFMSWLCRPMPTLYLACPTIGPGLFIEHGFSTIVAARSIGPNCWVNQQVTVGFEGSGSPVLGHNVRICAGAKVIGGITIGDNVTIGANAVVVKDVPANCTVAGVPAKIIRRHEAPRHSAIEGQRSP